MESVHVSQSADHLMTRLLAIKGIYVSQAKTLKNMKTDIWNASFLS
jgi:hypothetical protein